MRWIQSLMWKFQRFMYGRYGTDTLNLVLVIGAFACSILGRGNLLLLLLSLGLMSIALLRMCSKNITQRRKENAWLEGLFKPRADAKTHKHFACPKCRQKVRVPRGKGKIMITCPKCGEKFAKKS